VRGLTNFQLARYDEAFKDFQEVLKQQPQNQVAITFIAFCYLIKDQQPEAKKYIDQANKINPLPITVGAEAMYEARLGHKEKALALSKDFRVYLILGMKEEGIKTLLALFSKVPPPLNSYLVLTKSSVVNRVGSDARIIELIQKQKVGYDENKKKFKLPEIINKK
jgi:tetratricopeptide (TPR) repeat protein